MLMTEAEQVSDDGRAPPDYAFSGTAVLLLLHARNEHCADVAACRSHHTNATAIWYRDRDHLR
jgi:hypothetical protein